MKTSALAFVACCAAAGCAADSSIGSTESDLTARFGIDYAWGRPSTGSIRADGYSFAARYLSYDTSGKNLTPNEAAELRRAGIDVVVVWEAGASDALGGYSVGAAEARDAAKQARRLRSARRPPDLFRRRLRRLARR